MAGSTAVKKKKKNPDFTEKDSRVRRTEVSLYVGGGGGGNDYSHDWVGRCVRACGQWSSWLQKTHAEGGTRQATA